ncbi:MAG TPA: PilZ domain-containing protein [Rectinemataceae bacterium]|nr:PilZ domain-containing protein [Rectinemataceae bacterium]
MEEKRETPRFRINQLIGYFPNREEYLWAEGLDLSRGGLSCSAPQSIDPLTNVYLMLGVPNPEGERLVRCEGYVAHARMEAGRCLFGIRIERVSDEDEPFLTRFVQELEKSGAPLARPSDSGRA